MSNLNLSLTLVDVKLVIIGLVKYIFDEKVFPFGQYLAAGVDVLNSSCDASAHSASRNRNKDKIQIRNLHVM